MNAKDKAIRELAKLRDQLWDTADVISAADIETKNKLSAKGDTVDSIIAQLEKI